MNLQNPRARHTFTPPCLAPRQRSLTTQVPQGCVLLVDATGNLLMQHLGKAGRWPPADGRSALCKAGHHMKWSP